MGAPANERHHHHLPQVRFRNNRRANPRELQRLCGYSEEAISDKRRWAAGAYLCYTRTGRAVLRL
nr:MAG TPA: hypothetical protein [Caudoviricetes sp.]